MVHRTTWLGARVVLDPQRRVLGGELTEGGRHPVLVGAARRGHGRREQRLGKCPRGHEQRLVGGGERVGGLRAAELGHDDDLTGNGARLREQVPVEGRRDGARAHVLVVRGMALAGGNPEQLEVSGHVHRPVGTQGAREDAHEREVPDVGVGLRVDHLGHERSARVGRDGHGRAAGDRGHGRERVQPGVRERRLDHVQEHPDAGAGLGGQREHRVEGAVRDRREEVLLQGLEVELLTLEVALHQGTVLRLLDDPLDERGPERVEHLRVLGPRGAHGPHAAGVVVDLAEQEVGDRGHRARVTGNGDAERLDAGPEVGLAVGERGGEVGVAGVQLGDGDRTRHPDHRALVPQGSARGIRTVRGRDDEEGGIRRPQSRSHLPDEVGVARGVEDGHHHRSRRDGRRSQARRGLGPLPTGRSARDDRTDDVVEQPGLSRPARPDEDDVADARRAGDGRGLGRGAVHASYISPVDDFAQAGVGQCDEGRVGAPLRWVAPC